MMLEMDDVRVEFTHIGEGYQGYYDPDDPDDEPLLRFYVRAISPYTGEWEDVEDASYCTLLAEDTRADILDYALRKIMAAVYDPLKEGKDIDRICAILSWMEVEDLVEEMKDNNGQESIHSA